MAPSHHGLPLSQTASSSSSSSYWFPVSACPVLATPTCAFVYDVSLGLASLVWRLVNNN